MARASRVNGRWTVRCGLGRRMVRPPRVDGPEWSWRPGAAGPTLRADAARSASPAPTDRSPRPLIGTLARCGARRRGCRPRVPDHPDAARRAARCRAALPDRLGSSAALLVWALAIAAGAACWWSGPNRLAVALARHAIGRRPAAPLARVLAGLPDDVVVVDGSRAATDGRRPELVVGPFGVAVVHELAPLDGDPPGRLRRGKPGRRDGWTPDRATRSTGRRATPSASALAQRGRPRLRRPRLRGARDRRRDDHALAGLRGHHARADPGLARVAAPPAEPDRASRWRALVAVVRDGRRRATPGAVGRGARTRTWNQRDISPPL